MLMATGSVHALSIDTFDDPFQIVTKAAPGPSVVGTAEAVGGFREMEMLSVAGPLGATLAADVVDKLSLSNDALTGSVSAVTWNASGAGLGGVDLTDVGLSTFMSMEIISIDVGLIDIFMIVIDTGGDVATKLISGAGVGIFQTLFSDFTNFAATEFDSVDEIRMEFTAGEASDLVLDFVFSSGFIPPPPPIPEPSSLILLGMGVLGILGYGWKRRQKA